MKKVNFLGQEWEVPEWAVWITRDRNNTVYVWENEPVKDEYGDYISSLGDMEILMVDAVCVKI